MLLPRVEPFGDKSDFSDTVKVADLSVETRWLGSSLLLTIWQEADLGIEFIRGLRPFEDDPPFFTAALVEVLFTEDPDFEPGAGSPPPPLTTVTVTPLVDLVDPDEILVPTIPFEVTTVLVFL